MVEVKWIKICTDIFDDEKILLIERLPDADSVIVLWFKLLCLAGKQNNNGVFIMGNRLPYTDSMLATIFRRKEKFVQRALKVFEQFGMIEIVNDTITIPNWGKHQNLEQLENKKLYMRKYMQEYRSKQKELTCKTNSKTNSKTNVSEAEEDIDKDIDKNINIYNIHDNEVKDVVNSRAHFVKPSLEEVQEYCQERKNNIDAQRWFDYYSANGWKVGKNPMKDWKAAVRTWERNEDKGSNTSVDNKVEGINSTFDASYFDDWANYKVPDLKKREGKSI